MKMMAAFVVVGLLVPSVVQAQGTEAAIEVTRDVIRTERKAIVATSMALTEEQATAFWPVYNEYAEARRKIFDQRVQVIQKFAAEYETLTDEQAEALLKESFDFQQERVKVRRSFTKKFGKVLTGKRVARFFQIDGKIDSIIDFDIARTVPLVR